MNYNSFVKRVLSLFLAMAMIVTIMIPSLSSAIEVKTDKIFLTIDKIEPKKSRRDYRCRCSPL